jgi:hypothetical protein
MLSRRGFATVGAGLIASGVIPRQASAITVPSPGVLHFDVLRNGTKIGQHVVRLSQSGTTWRAKVAVELAVGIGPITVFRYTHSVHEEWQDGQFRWMESRTNDDGTAHHVVAEHSADGVSVRRGAGGTAVLLPGTIPLTHWNHACMRAPLFNPQTGLPLNMTVQRRALETIDMGGGRTVRAQRYALVGEATMDTWYDDTEIWTALRSAGRDGSMISYRRAG